MVISAIVLIILIVLLSTSTSELDYQDSKNNSIVNTDIKLLKKVPKYEADCSDDKFINLTTERDLFQNCALADDLSELGAKKLDFQLKRCF